MSTHLNTRTDKNSRPVLMFSPSGALIDETLLDRACEQLRLLGFNTAEAPDARARVERFAGDERTRAASLNTCINRNVASILMATRGGYGLSRLLPQLDFPALADALNSQGHVLCGHSDITCLQLALLNAGAHPKTLLHGPMACFDFGPEQGVNTSTLEHFQRAVLQGEVNIDWRDTVGHGDEPGPTFAIDGQVWGGNLSLLCSMVGTPWLPGVHNGILVLEDVNEPAYKIERMLLQLLHCGVLGQQQAIVLGNFSEPKPGPHDNGYSLISAAGFVQEKLGNVPVLMNFPFGHSTPKACWFQGGKGHLWRGADGSARLTQTLR